MSTERLTAKNLTPGREVQTYEGEPFRTLLSIEKIGRGVNRLHFTDGTSYASGASGRFTVKAA